MLIRTVLVIVMHTGGEVDRVEPVNIALSLAHGRGFANAFGEHSGPTAHISPVWPIFLSLIFRIFGDGSTGALVQQLAGCAVASASYALLPAVAEAIGLPMLAGFAGGIAAALLPINFWPERGVTSTVCAPLFIALILIYCAKVWREQSFDIRSAVTGGVLAGVVLLTEPALLTLMTVGAISAGVASRSIHLKYWAVFVTVTGLLIAPWVIRNYRVLGAPIWTRSNLGLELSVSNADIAAPTLEENGMPGGAISQLHPYANKEQLAHLERVGEVAYNRDRMQVAIEWIKTHPQRFLQLTALRILRFWFPKMLRPLQTVVVTTITLLGISGLALFAIRRRLANYLMPLLLFIVFPLPYYIVQTSSRYRFPLEPFILLFAAWSGYWLPNVRRKPS